MIKHVGTGKDMGGQRITNLGDASGATDAVTKQQLDNAIAGLAWKAPVRVATTTNGTLATAYANGQTIDGVTLATGNRILIKDQTTGSENGIYTVNASGAPTRATDANSTAELNSATVYVIAGTTNADKAFTQTANDPTVDTTALAWAQVGGGTAYTAGNGMTLSGSTFNVGAGTGIVVNADDVAVDPAYAGFVKRYSVDVPTNNPATITHNFGTKDRLGEPAVVIVSTGELVDVDITLGTNSDTLTFGTTPTTGQYRYSNGA